MLLKEDEKLDSIPNGNDIADGATPGKPAIIIYSEGSSVAFSGLLAKGGSDISALAAAIESKLGDNIWLGG